MLTVIVNNLYRLSFKQNKFVVFQNEEDLKEFIPFLGKNKAVLIKSSGVNLKYFSKEVCQEFSKFKINKKYFTFLFVGRFLKDKGIYELIKACKKLSQDDFLFNLWILGSIDKGNPASMSEEELNQLKKLSFIKILPFAKDVRPYLCASDCVVLPSSYREGIPRSLLEAMAMEKPIITTDAPGCRDVCFDEVNGFLVRPKDEESLYMAMKRMIELSEAERKSMGVAGRKIVQENFSEDIVIRKYIEVINKILKEKQRTGE